MGHPQILPGTGRWQCAALTEGGLLVAQHIAQPLWHAPSTPLRAVPLPVPGRI